MTPPADLGDHTSAFERPPKKLPLVALTAAYRWQLEFEGILALDPALSGAHEKFTAASMLPLPSYLATLG